MLRPYWYAQRLVGLLEVAEEVGVGMVEERTVGEIVIGDCVAGGFDLCDEFGMAEGALADEEECCVGVVLVEDFEDLRREDGVRAVIEGERDERLAGGDAIGDVWRQALEQRQEDWRLGPEED